MGTKSLPDFSKINQFIGRDLDIRSIGGVNLFSHNLAEVNQNFIRNRFLCEAIPAQNLVSPEEALKLKSMMNLFLPPCFAKHLPIDYLD